MSAGGNNVSGKPKFVSAKQKCNRMKQNLNRTEADSSFLPVGRYLPEIVPIALREIRRRRKTDAVGNFGNIHRSLGKQSVRLCQPELTYDFDRRFACDGLDFTVELDPRHTQFAAEVFHRELGIAHPILHKFRELPYESTVALRVPAILILGILPRYRQFDELVALFLQFIALAFHLFHLLLQNLAKSQLQIGRAHV